MCQLFLLIYLTLFVLENDPPVNLYFIVEYHFLHPLMLQVILHIYLFLLYIYIIILIKLQKYIYIFIVSLQDLDFASLAAPTMNSRCAGEL